MHLPHRLGARLEKVLVGAVLFIPAVSWSLAASEHFRLPKALVGSLLTLAAVSLAAVRPRPAPRNVSGAVAGAVAIVVLLVCWCRSPDGVPGGTDPDLYLVVALVFAFHMFSASPEFERLVPVVMLAGLFNALLALAQAAGVNPLWQESYEGRFAVYGTFGNPNYLGEYLAPLAVLAAGLGLAAATPARRAACGSLALVFAGVVVLTGGRGGWLGLVAGGVTLLALQPRRPGGGWRWSLLAAPIAVAALWSPLRSRLAGLFDPQDPTVATRLFMWRTAVAIAAVHPLTGAGLNGFGAHYLDAAAALQALGKIRPLYAGITRDAHNDYLQVLVATGLVGVAIIGWFGWTLARATAARLRVASPPDRARGAAVAGGIAAILAEGAVSTPFAIFPTAMVFVWLLAVLSGEPQVPAPADRRRSWWWLPAAIVLGWLVGRPMLADRYLAAGGGWLDRGLKISGSGELHFRRGLVLERQGSFPAARTEFLAAVRRLKDPDVYFNLGFMALAEKNYEEAAVWYEKGLRWYPYFRARPHADLAEAYAGLNRKPEALAAARQALAIDPDLVQAQQLILRLQRRGAR